jgi:hypothetical protein
MHCGLGRIVSGQNENERRCNADVAMDRINATCAYQGWQARLLVFSGIGVRDWRNGESARGSSGGRDEEHLTTQVGLNTGSAPIDRQECVIIGLGKPSEVLDHTSEHIIELGGPESPSSALSPASHYTTPPKSAMLFQRLARNSGRPRYAISISCCALFQYHSRGCETEAAGTDSRRIRDALNKSELQRPGPLLAEMQYRTVTWKDQLEGPQKFACWIAYCLLLVACELPRG